MVSCCLRRRLSRCEVAETDAREPAWREVTGTGLDSCGREERDKGSDSKEMVEESAGCGSEGSARVTGRTEGVSKDSGIETEGGGWAGIGTNGMAPSPEDLSVGASFDS